MKKIILVFSILCAIASAAALQWHGDFNSAALKAKKENKALMVMIESEHCRWCKAMKETTLNDEKVKSELKSFVSVKIMREDTESMRLFPEIAGVPTIFFMTSDRKILQQVIGFYEEEDFLPFIADAKKKFRQK